MLLKISLIISTYIIILNNAYGKSEAEVLLKNSTPEEQGLAIAVEQNFRENGFKDFQVDTNMTLTNSYGQTTIRISRNKTFEMDDQSVGDKTLIIFDSPRDIKGTTFLTHSKIIDPDDQWLFLPSLKRVKRISSRNKSGPFLGSEFAYEDIGAQEIGKFSYKYLRSETCPTDEIQSLKCFVIERYPNYKYSGYSKQMVWIDTKEFRPYKTEYFNRRGELLKTLTYKDYQQYLNRFWKPSNLLMVNHKTNKKTALIWKNYRFNTGLTENLFTQAKLKQVR